MTVRCACVIALLFMTGCATGVPQVAVANSLQQQQLAAVRGDIMRIVRAYDRDLRHSYQSQADIAFLHELEKAQSNGALTSEAVLALVQRSRDAVRDRISVLDAKLEELETNENLEDAIRLNEAEGRWIRAQGEAAASLQEIIQGLRSVR